MNTAAQLSPAPNKDDLQKTLKLMESFDAPGSPYVGIQFVEGKPEFYRSSDNGFAKTKDFTTGEVFANLHQFVQYLNYLPDNVDVSVAPNGVLQLHADNGNFPVNLCVHTVLQGQAGLVRHAIAERTIEMKPETFAGIDMAFVTTKTLGGQPTIASGKLVIPVNAGTVIWEGLDSLLPTQTWSPMFSFLKLVGGDTVEDLYISHNGYWHCAVNGVSVYMKGWTGDPFLFRRQTALGKEICKFTAPALLWGLTGAASMSEEAGFMMIDPTSGITTQDKFGNPAQWMLDQGLSFPKFRITGSQAKLIVNALKQGEGDFVTMSDVPTDAVHLMRFQRGKFTVNISL